MLFVPVYKLNGKSAASKFGNRFVFFLYFDLEDLKAEVITKDVGSDFLRTRILMMKIQGASADRKIYVAKVL